ncbi:AMP-binding protein [Amycolatopsis minnesotensis]|uniref:AMP-binding protein n=1 Tax=Amycolatopsis minnesotensis TaxID=337894 RepID=UPI0031DDADB8
MSAKHTASGGRLLPRSGSTDGTPVRAVHQLFEARVARDPLAVAVVCGDREIRYGELNARANLLARHPRTLGAGPGWDGTGGDDRNPEAAGHDDLAYAICTSGSTGDPKGVLVEHGHLLAIAASWENNHNRRTVPHARLRPLGTAGNR